METKIAPIYDTLTLAYLVENECKISHNIKTDFIRSSRRYDDES